MNRATWLQGRRMLKFRDVLSCWERRELSNLEAGELLGMSERHRPESVAIGPRLCGLDRACATRGFDRRKTEARADLETGDRYLRRILVVGAHAVLRRARQQPERSEERRVGQECG